MRKASASAAKMRSRQIETESDALFVNKGCKLPAAGSSMALGAGFRVHLV